MSGTRITDISPASASSEIQTKDVILAELMTPLSVHVSGEGEEGDDEEEENEEEIEEENEEENEEEVAGSSLTLSPEAESLMTMLDLPFMSPLISPISSPIMSLAVWQTLTWSPPVSPSNPAKYSSSSSYSPYSSTSSNQSSQSSFLMYDDKDNNHTSSSSDHYHSNDVIEKMEKKLRDKNMKIVKNVRFSFTASEDSMDEKSDEKHENNVVRNEKDIFFSSSLEIISSETAKRFLNNVSQ